jgi:hypothetical protein
LFTKIINDCINLNYCQATFAFASKINPGLSFILLAWGRFCQIEIAAKVGELESIAKTKSTQNTKKFSEGVPAV